MEACYQLSFRYVKPSEKSPENKCDRQTDGQTDRVQTYSPLLFHRWGLIEVILYVYLFERNQILAETG